MGDYLSTCLTGEESKPNARSFCADILGDRDVQRNVRSGFRLQSRIADSEASAHDQVR